MCHLPIILIVFLGYAVMAQDDCNNKFEKGSVNLLSTQELSTEFRKFKVENNSCNDVWGSDFHLIMQQLGRRLGKKGTHKEEVTRWMDSPDYQSDSIDAIKLNADEEIMVYHWRGWHDWLYFIIKDDMVKNYDWWFAYE